MGMKVLAALIGLSLLIGQMVRLPLSSKGIQFIDAIIFILLVQISIRLTLNGLRNTKQSRPLLIVFAIFIIWCTISALYGLMHYALDKLPVSDFIGGILAAGRFLAPLLILGYILTAKINTNSAVEILRNLYLVALVVIFFGICQAFFIENFAIRYGPDYEWDVQGNRLVSIFLDPNLAASFTSGILILTLFLQIKNLLARRLLLAGAILSLIATVLTLSRGGILGLAVGIFAFYFYNRRSIRVFRFTNLIAIFLASMLVLASMFYVFDLEFLVESDRFGAGNESALIRFGNYLGLIRIFLENPIFGVGFNYSRSLYIDYFSGFSGNYVDGGVLLLLSSLGIIGAASLFAALMLIKKVLFLDMSLYGPFIVMFVVQSFATSTIFYPLIICFFALVLALTQRTLKLGLN